MLVVLLDKLLQAFGDGGLVYGELQLTILNPRVLKLPARNHLVHCCKFPVQFFGALCEVLIQIRVDGYRRPTVVPDVLSPLAAKQVVLEVCVAAAAGNPTPLPNGGRY